MTSSKSVGCAASWRRSPAVSLRVRCWPRTNAVQRLSMAAAALLATRSSMEFTPALRCASRLCGGREAGEQGEGEEEEKEEGRGHKVCKTRRQ